jgi:galactokinase
MSILGPDARAVRLRESALPSEAAAALAARFAALAARSATRTMAAGDPSAWFVPGRIEVVGKHTDYAGGRSLVCAVDRGLAVVARPRGDDLVTIEDAGRASALELRVSADEPSIRWGLYPLTVLRRLARNFPGPLRGADILFESDLPTAAGMSSSSALMIAVLLVLARVNRLPDSPQWKSDITSQLDLAAYAATIENGSGFRGLAGERGVGTEGGSQDHTAILCSAPGHLTQFRYRPSARERTIALPDDAVFVIGVSGVRAQKTGGARDAYNRAARSVAEVLDRWCTGTGARHETLADAIAAASDASARMRELLKDRPDLVDRLDQFVEESTVVVPSAAERLAAGDLAGFGAIVDRSQALAERLLRNQIPETAALARLARAHGAAAASAFGAGFGGSVWALVGRADVPRFVEKWQNAYREAHPALAERSAFFMVQPGPPAFEVALDS